MATAEQGFATLRTALIVVYGALLVISPLASWVMARAALAPVKRSYELQRQFVDDASHEMRSPLAVIQGELELALARSRTPAQYQQAIAVAAASTEELIRLTNSLLLLSRGASDELTSSFDDIDIDALVGGAVAASTTEPTDRARLESSLASGVSIRGNRNLLTGAVTNLIDNALKFTPPEGTVRVSTYAHLGSVQIAVRDTGIGMTAGQLTHARDRFWRADAARATQGHGLGLALVDEIVRGHHGTLEIRSDPGSGTTATMTLLASRPPRLSR